MWAFCATSNLMFLKPFHKATIFHPSNGTSPLPRKMKFDAGKSYHVGLTIYISCYSWHPQRAIPREKNLFLQCRLLALQWVEDVKIFDLRCLTA